MEINGRWVNERGIWIVISSDANRVIGNALRSDTFFYKFYPNMKIYEEELRQSKNVVMGKTGQDFDVNRNTDGFGVCSFCGFRMYFLKSEVRKRCPGCWLKLQALRYITKGDEK